MSEAGIGAEAMAVYRFKALRKAYGMTQADIGRALGIGSTQVTRLERGQRRLLFGEAVALMDLFAVTWPQVMGDEPITMVVAP